MCSTKEAAFPPAPAWNRHNLGRNPGVPPVFFPQVLLELFPYSCYNRTLSCVLYTKDPQPSTFLPRSCKSVVRVGGEKGKPATLFPPEVIRLIPLSPFSTIFSLSLCVKQHPFLGSFPGCFRFLWLRWNLGPQAQGSGHCRKWTRQYHWSTMTLVYPSLQLQHQQQPVSSCGHTSSHKRERLPCIL